MKNSNNNVVYACIAGFSLFVIAMGINRFSYAPIIPYLINEHWLNMPQSGYVGSANFLGYFIGALSAHRLTRHFKTNKLMLTILVVSVIASALCIFNINYVWLSVWRLVVGIVAGMIMVLTPTIILKNTPHEKKAVISGIMFAGIGIGIVATSLLTPVFDSWGSVKSIWASLAILTAILGLIASYKCLTFKPEAPARDTHNYKIERHKRGIFIFALMGYALYAVGLAPSLLFLSDYAHRNLGASTELSSMLFAILGLGCAVGSVTAGWMQNKIGNYLAVLVTSVIGILSLAVIAFIPSVIAVAISAFLTGFYLIALVVLMSLFVGKLVGMQNHAKYWSYMTLLFAGAQFIAGYVFSYTLNFKFSYHHMFEIGFMVLILSLVSYLFLNGKHKSAVLQHNSHK